MTKKKSKRKSRSEENKRKWAEKREREAAERKAAKKKAVKKKAVKKPPIEKSDVETTPWPRAGENKEFQEILDQTQPVQTPAPAAKIIKDKAEGQEEPELKVDDVAEWVKWPFQIWSQSQNLQPIIRPDEALEISKPLTRILNRHGVSEKIPPDVLDGMQVVGRTVPVIKRGNDMVKSERQRRAKARPVPVAPGTIPRTPQGAPATQPKEI